MDTMAPLRPTVQRPRRISLAAGPAAAGEARSQVRAAIRAWDVPVDVDTAVLLTSELVTNALKHATGGTITLTITCVCGQLRVDVHDASRCAPTPVNTPVDNLATSRRHPTSAGKAVYFTLAFQGDLDEGGGDSPRAHRAWAR
jgi:anti-sigma regulatory factor (Ser/Thr protein kinase)